MWANKMLKIKTCYFRTQRVGRQKFEGSIRILVVLLTLLPFLKPHCSLQSCKNTRTQLQSSHSVPENLLVRVVMRMMLQFSKCALHPTPPPSPPRSNIIAQSAWNESAQQEKQFNILYVGVGVTISGSVAIKQRWSKTVR